MRNQSINSKQDTKDRDHALAAFHQAHAQVYGNVIDDDWNTNYTYDDNPEEEQEQPVNASVKSILEQIDSMEYKGVRHVRTAEGAKKFKVPIGSVIGEDGKPVASGRAGRTEHFVPAAPVHNISVTHNADGSKTVTQHMNDRTYDTVHPNMASADAQIDEILDHHGKIDKIHHFVPSGKVDASGRGTEHEFIIHHSGRIDHRPGGQSTLRRNIGTYHGNSLTNALHQMAATHETYGTYKTPRGQRRAPTLEEARTAEVVQSGRRRRLINQEPQIPTNPTNEGVGTVETRRRRAAAAQSKDDIPMAHDSDGNEIHVGHTVRLPTGREGKVTRIRRDPSTLAIGGRKPGIIHWEAEHGSGQALSGRVKTLGKA